VTPSRWTNPLVATTASTSASGPSRAFCHARIAGSPRWKHRVREAAKDAHELRFHAALTKSVQRRPRNPRRPAEDRERRRTARIAPEGDRWAAPVKSRPGGRPLGRERCRTTRSPS
jgi:hypothetical protein